MDRQDIYFLTEQFRPFVTTHKQELIETVLRQRTEYMTVVLEDIYHPQNASAVIRTCECFGIQNLHIIENKHNYKVNPKVVLGASKWVDMVKYDDPESDNLTSCIQNIKAAGYQLIGTTPDPSAMSLYDFEINQKSALIFGTEDSGLSQNAIEHCDQMVRIPMHGFSESLNLSVCVSIFLSFFTRQLYALPSGEWSLSEDQKSEIRLDWYRKIVPRAEILEKEFLKKLVK